MSKEKQDWRIVALVILSFAGCYTLFQLSGRLRDLMSPSIPWPILRYVLTYCIIGIPVFLGTMIIHGDLQIQRYLGCTGPLLNGFLLSVVFTLPMLLGGILLFSFRDLITLDRVLKASLFAGFFEELYFRGFLFGQIFRYTRVGFIPAIVFGALLFAAGHLTQSSDPAELAAVFITTFMGAVLFAWLFVEWGYNLWVPIFMHILMNLSWELFAYGDTAAGTTASNLLRGLTIALSILGTILYKKRRSMPLAIHKTTLWWKRNS